MRAGGSRDLAAALEWHGASLRAGFRRFPDGPLFRVVGDWVPSFACFPAGRDPAHWSRQTDIKLL